VPLIALSSAMARSASEYDYAATIKAIARDIAGLRPEFPPLRDFSATQNVLFDKLAIDYGYHTHRYAGPGDGWRADVPNPNDDGIWLHIDFHDAASTAPIHTRPMTPTLCCGDKRAAFLLLEGARTKPLRARLSVILEAHGTAPCPKHES
jgi:hypothetical protein